MTVVHRLVGYDRNSDRVAFEKYIPPAELMAAMQISNVPFDDPDAIFDYALNPMQARDIAGLLHVIIAHPDNLHFVLEAFDTKEES